MLFSSTWHARKAKAAHSKSSPRILTQAHFGRSVSLSQSVSAQSWEMMAPVVYAGVHIRRFVCKLLAQGLSHCRAQRRPGATWRLGSTLAHTSLCLEGPVTTVAGRWCGASPHITRVGKLHPACSCSKELRPGGKEVHRAMRPSPFNCSLTDVVLPPGSSPVRRKNAACFAWKTCVHNSFTDSSLTRQRL